MRQSHKTTNFQKRRSYIDSWTDKAKLCQEALKLKTVAVESSKKRNTLRKKYHYQLEVVSRKDDMLHMLECSQKYRLSPKVTRDTSIPGLEESVQRKCYTLHIYYSWLCGRTCWKRWDCERLRRTFLHLINYTLQAIWVVSSYKVYLESESIDHCNILLFLFTGSSIQDNNHTAL